jgi:aminopeptidase N
MSRSYRIKVSESLRRVLRAEDHVTSQLEVLEILPAEQMAELLGRELLGQGFQVEGNQATRRDGDVTIVVDLEQGTVTVRAEGQAAVDLRNERTGTAYEEQNRNQVEAALRKEIAEQLEQEAARQASALQQQVTDRLEGTLADVRDDLNRAVNRATAQALKQKAAQIGQIKDMTEDPTTGSLTIVVEV